MTTMLIIALIIVAAYGLICLVQDWGKPRCKRCTSVLIDGKCSGGSPNCEVGVW